MLSGHSDLTDVHQLLMKALMVLDLVVVFLDRAVVQHARLPPHITMR